MKLTYDILISPFSFYIDKVGHIKSITLREIWEPKITYKLYQFFISMLALTPSEYFECINRNAKEWYNSYPEDERTRITMFQLIVNDTCLQKAYQDVLNFFMVENVSWVTMDELSGFTLKDEDDNIVGFISSHNFDDIIDVILQRLGIGESSQKTPKFKNKKVQADWERMKKNKAELAKRNKRVDRRLELPNIISAYASNNHNSINMINIWDLTVYQLRDQFDREQTAQGIDINKMSVAHWGDKENHFDISSWFKILY